MIILITGASHTGKTVLAQKLLEKYKYPYLSIDHLKMGLIRSGYTKLTPEEDRFLCTQVDEILCGNTSARQEIEDFIYFLFDISQEERNYITKFLYG